MKEPDQQQWVTGQVRLTIGGQPLDLEMTVPAQATNVRRMLPVFRQMSNSFATLGTQGVGLEGKEVSCKAGCGACCRQPVPLAQPEAFEIAELVAGLPERRRTEVTKRFEEACARLIESGWFERLDASADMDDKGRAEVIAEYFKHGIPCPFLEEESCSIHEQRPLACREYLVTSPAENCASPNAEGIDMVPLVAKPSVTLNAMTRQTNLGGAVNFVPLVLSLIWADKYSEDMTEKTGEEWMKEFFRGLTQQEIPGSD